MNYAILVLDYLMQTKEINGRYDVARAKEHLYSHRNEMAKDDYLRTYELIDRIAAQEGK